MNSQNFNLLYYIVFLHTFFPHIYLLACNYYYCISIYCYNKLPQMWQLKSTQIYYSSKGQKSEMGAVGLQSRCQQGCILLESSGKNPFPASFSFQRLFKFLGSCLFFHLQSLQHRIIKFLSDSNLLLLRFSQDYVQPT